MPEDLGTRTKRFALRVFDFIQRCLRQLRLRFLGNSPYVRALRLEFIIFEAVRSRSDAEFISKYSLILIMFPDCVIFL